MAIFGEPKCGLIGVEAGDVKLVARMVNAKGMADGTRAISAREMHLDTDRRHS